MCTAICMKTKNSYFGRNLDLEYSYEESVTVAPRLFPFHFKNEKSIFSHPAIIGMAYIKDGYPLYYDGANESGLSVAALNFPGFALYGNLKSAKYNVAPFEFIPFVLSRCKNTTEAKKLIENTNITDEYFSEDLKNTPLHWMISDGTFSLVAEQTESGMKVYENQVGVLTNSPEFPYHLENLKNYMHLCPDPPKNLFCESYSLSPYSRGMGAIGLPGDWSSASRFVRASFVKLNSVCNNSEEESVGQFFHILDSVAHPRGSVRLDDGSFQITQYSSCINLSEGIYYYTTYENKKITAVDMHTTDLKNCRLKRFPVEKRKF